MSHFFQFEGIESLPEFFFDNRPLHLAIGIFDGLHRGHQAVIRSAMESAKEDNGSVGLLTFWPHPSRLFRPEKPICMLMPPEQKNNLLRVLGLDFVIQQKFDASFASITAEDFVPLLKKALPSLKTIYVGANFYFGKGRKGNILKLMEEGSRSAIKVISSPRVSHEGRAISSTWIRSELSSGNIEKVNTLLSYPYFMEGVVQKGQSLGQKIGFPTLNLLWTPELRPRYGVYIVRLKNPLNKGAFFPGVANYGLRPTVVNAQEIPLLEVHLFEDSFFKAGDFLKVEWLHFIRPEKRFTSLDELKMQINKDKKVSKNLWTERFAAVNDDLCSSVKDKNDK